MKRLLSVLLAAAMVLGIMCSAPFVVSATDGEEENEGYNIYFIASNGWTDVTAYAYSIDEEYGGIYEEETVTGEELNRTAPDGSKIFGFNISIYFTNINFSNSTGDAIERAMNIGYWGLSYAYYESESDLWYESLSNTDLTSLVDTESTNAIITGDGNYRYYIEKFDGNMTARFSSYIGRDAEVTVPDKFLDCPVTSIDVKAFEGLESLEAIHISANVNNITPMFITDCDALTTLTVAEENEVYTSKGTVDGVYKECSAVIHIENKTLVAGTPNQAIPAEVTIIGEGAYSRHSGLTEITIPENITTIENYAFEVTEINELYIPKSVTDIGDAGVIYACCNLQTITVAEENEVYTSKGTVNGVPNTDCNVIIEKETDTETEATDYKLIGGCLTSKIPTEVTIIGAGVFDSLSDFDGFSLHEGIKSIGSNAFYECHLITKLHIPETVTHIGENAFAGCELETITVATNNPVYTSQGTIDGEKKECNAIIQTQTVTKSVTDPETGEVTYNDVETGVIVLGGRYTKFPAEVTVIGVSAFQNRTSLYKIIIPEHIDTIQSSAFFNCISLRKITILNENCAFEDYPIDNGEFCATIYGKENSTAQAYAEENGMPFKLYNTDESSTVYFVASNGWENVTSATASMYYGDGQDSGEATAIESVQNDYGYSVYSVKFEEEYESVTFVNGENEIFTNEFFGGWYFDGETENWYESLEALKNDIDDSEDDYPEENYDPELGFYLVGTIWGEEYDYVDYTSINRMLTYNEEEELYRFDNIYFFEGDKIQVVEISIEDGEIKSTHFVIEGKEWYTIAEGKEGYYTVYFNPNGNEEWDYYYINVVKHECEHENVEDGVCTDCGELAPGNIAGAAGYSVTLSGKIEVNYYMLLSKEVRDDLTAEMIFTVPNASKTNPEETDILHFRAKYAEKFEQYYIFTCEVAAKEMASVIKSKVVSNGEESEVFDYSVIEYLDYIITEANKDNPEYTGAAPLAKAMLNYGAYSQIYFGNKTDNLANKNLSDDEKVLDDIPDLIEYKYVINDDDEDITYYGSTLALESGTSIKHYFIMDDTVAPSVLEDIAVTMNGEDYYWYRCRKNGDFYEIEICNIYAQNLDDKFELTIGGITLEYSPFSYGYQTMKGNKTNLKNVIKAIYAYNVAANDYLEY